MLFYVSVKSLPIESGVFLGACALDCANHEAAHQAAKELVRASGQTCEIETLIVPISQACFELAPMPTGRLVSLEEMRGIKGGLQDVRLSRDSR